MCTICKLRPKVFKATEDIPVYKAVFKEGDNYITPFMLTPVTKVMVPENPFLYPIPKKYQGNPILLVEGGYIHSFLTFIGDRTYFIKGHILLRGYIPKGTEYLISADGYSICSRKLILCMP